MRKTLLVVQLLVAACGSANAPLTYGGEQIEVTSGDVPSNCRFVAPLSAEYGTNFQSYETNLELATNDLRNQAAERGATHILLADEQQTRGIWSSPNCRNCVRLSARAFHCSATPPMRAPPPTPPAMARPPSSATCLPPCRSGYTCIAGQCVSACNPPCAAQERCSAAGECEPAPPGAPGASADGSSLPPPAPPPAIAPPPGASAPAQPTRADVVAAMAGVKDAVSSCAGNRRGSVSIQVVFEGSGRVTSASVTSPNFAGTPAGTCMAQAVEAAHVPAFTNPSLTITFPFVIP